MWSVWSNKCTALKVLSNQLLFKTQSEPPPSLYCDLQKKLSTWKCRRLTSWHFREFANTRKNCANLSKTPRPECLWQVIVWWQNIPFCSFNSMNLELTFHNLRQRIQGHCNGHFSKSSEKILAMMQVSCWSSLVDHPWTIILILSVSSSWWWYVKHYLPDDDVFFFDFAL